MYTKFHEIELDQPTWAVALLTTVEQKETKSKQPFCVFTLQDGEKTIQANIWNTQKENVKLEQGLISVQLYKKIYNGTESWEVKAYDAAPLDAKMEDFIITAPIPSEQMLQEILAILTKEIGNTGSDRTKYDEKSLAIRAFTEAQKRRAYERQNHKCPCCVKNGIDTEYAYNEMQGDHIIPWSQGGRTIDSNLQMLCQKCNNDKSNQ